MVWTTLIAGGVVAWWTTRSLLLADLDATIIARARALPELSGSAESAARVEEAAGDRYIVSNRLGQTRGRLAETSAQVPLPAVLQAALTTLGDGRRLRTLALRFTPRDGSEPINVIYSRSAANVQGVLRHLAIALTIFGIAAGAGAAAVAVAVSRAALRPLRGTAEVIGAIDERRLDRRIDVAALPPELAPVGERLNEMLGRIEQAFAQREQFLADASHELRTPVAALVTALEVALRRPRDAAELTRVLRCCLTDSRMLRELVEALMEHARDQADNAAPESERFDLAELLNRCCDVVDGLAEGKNVTIVRSISPVLWVCSQPRRIRGIAMNLLGNAIEYNRPAGTVELSAAPDGADIELCVADTGRGISPRHLPHVFQPFYRAGDHDSASAVEEGPRHMGLGLFLVDSHIKALGGVCQIESEPGVGTRVRVRLSGLNVQEPIEMEMAPT